MHRHFNTHTEGIDLKFWYGLIESRGRLVTFNAGDCICRAGEPATSFGYVKSGYFCYEFLGSDGETKIGCFTFENALIGDVDFADSYSQQNFFLTPSVNFERNSLKLNASLKAAGIIKREGGRKGEK